MIERTASTGDPRPELVRQSLRALADGSAPGARPSASGATDDRERVATVVRDAESTTSCARAAATFLGEGRLAELEAAVATADRQRWTGLSRRGRRVQATLNALDAALSGGGSSKTDLDHDSTTSTALAERF